VVKFITVHHIIADSANLFGDKLTESATVFGGESEGRKNPARFDALFFQGFQIGRILPILPFFYPAIRPFGA
jgi:hypothetical protein